MFKMKNVVTIMMLICLFSCAPKTDSTKITIDNIAESYVKLVLRVGLYDPMYIDAYFGPEEWKPSEAMDQQKKEFPHDQLHAEAAELISQLKKVDQSEFDTLEKQRYAYLEKELLSAEAKIDLLSGKKMTFDEESKALYDAIAPPYNKDYFENILKELDKALPGQGEIYERYNKFRSEFIIPKDKLDAVLKASMAECRKRTMKHIKLPDNEGMDIEYVTDKPWTAYNWYKGKFYSLIQVNIDSPTSIDSALAYAGHEGYPGHHIYNSLLEMKLYREKNWVEFSVDPLFSAKSLLSEGLANYGIEVAFPGRERVEFERDVLFPLAGLDPSKAEGYHKIHELMRESDYAMVEAARQYLDGKNSKKETIDWLIRYCLMTPQSAEQMVRFMEVYRSYLINYTTGENIIKNYIEKHGGTADHPEKRWALFVELLSTPHTPSGLQ